jgi:hypothetical protein
MSNGNDGGDGNGISFQNNRILSEKDGQYKFKDSYTIKIDSCQFSNTGKKGTAQITVPNGIDDINKFLDAVADIVDATYPKVDNNTIMVVYDKHSVVIKQLGTNNWIINGWHNSEIVVQQVNAEITVEKFIVIDNILEPILYLKNVTIPAPKPFDVRKYIKDNYEIPVACPESGLHHSYGIMPNIIINTRPVTH